MTSTSAAPVVTQAAPESLAPGIPGKRKLGTLITKCAFLTDVQGDFKYFCRYVDNSKVIAWDELTISDHPHVLSWSNGLRGHYCNLCSGNIECDGYRCSKSCNFDVCMKCARGKQGQNPPNRLKFRGKDTMLVFGGNSQDNRAHSFAVYHYKHIYYID
jgi:hypothetical protein